MKADIPDSIIISRDKAGVLHHSYWTTDQQLVPFEDTIYIRKDALMEMFLYAQEAAGGDYQKAVYQMAIDKLNSM